MQQRVIKSIFLIMALILLFGAVACQAQNEAQASVFQDSGAMGALILSVNPQIEIQYDQAGLVTGLTGLNEDGKSVIAAYGKGIGMACDQVVSDLVECIHVQGYFVPGDDGAQKQVVLKLKAGSRCPDDSFLETVTEKVRTTVDSWEQPAFITLAQAQEKALAYLGLADAQLTKAVFDAQDGKYEFIFTAAQMGYGVDVDAYTGNILRLEQAQLTVEPTALPGQDGFIGLEAAKKLVLQKLGLTSAEFIKAELDAEDRKYELELIVDGIEYDFDIDAYSGAFLKQEQETVGSSAGSQPSASGVIGLDAAKKIVLKKLGLNSATFTKAKLDKEDGEYELELIVNGIEYEFDIDAYTGAIVKQEQETVGSSAGSQPSASDVIGLDAAKKIVLKKLGLNSATFTKAKLDKEDGEYELELIVNGIEYEFDIDAYSGRILKMEQEGLDGDDDDYDGYCDDYARHGYCDDDDHHHGRRRGC